MTAGEATKMLAHLPADELASAIALVSFICGTTEEEVVAASICKARTDVDLDALQTQIDAVFTLARLDAKRHKLDRSH